MTVLDPEEFLDGLGVTTTVKAMMARSAEEYERTGNWVSFDTLAHEAASLGAPYDLREVFKVPTVLGGAWSGERINLTALGLVLAGTAPRIVDRMVLLARICGERKLRLREEATISGDDLVTEYQFSQDDAARAVDLISLIPGLSGGGSLGDAWSLTIFRTALDYRDVRTPEDLRVILQGQAEDQMRLFAQSRAVAPPFQVGGLFGPEEGQPPSPGIAGPPEPDEPSAVFVVHGRDDEAKDAVFAFLEDIGLHPLDWDEDLVAYTGQGTPFVGEILSAAFSHAQAVVVLMTPDDLVHLHPDLVRPGELAFETTPACQPRPNVLFEAGMAFGYCPTRTILVEIGTLRPVSDLGGRHTVRVGTAQTLRSLVRRLEVAGCPVDRGRLDAIDIDRLTVLAARDRAPTEHLEPRS